MLEWEVEAPESMMPLMGQATIETEMLDGWQSVRRPFRQAIEDRNNDGHRTLVHPECRELQEMTVEVTKGVADSDFVINHSCLVFY